MNDDPNAGTTSDGVSRRRVIRTAGTAAWAGPVIVTASAAPAYASSAGAAIIRTNPIAPSFGLLGNQVSVRTDWSNIGTAAPASMDVVVTITPSSGTLANADPTSVSDGFGFVGRTGTTGPQVLTFRKLPPQIPGGGSARLDFDIVHLPDALGTRSALVQVVPSVPPPSSGVGNQNTYTSTD